MKTVFVNPERCVGCKQCQIACAVEHSQSKTLFQSLSEEQKPRPRILVASGLYLDTSFPNKCRHCEPAPCMTICPTGAISRIEKTGIVIVDETKCIACAMCAMVCPFDVITFYTSSLNKLAAIKCDHCVERQDRGEIPACVETCKTGALVFGDINELVKTARTKLAQSVSIAVKEIDAGEARIPANISAWRGMGEAISKMGKEN
jgi:carbon-monoxide dehydrogenase iron sulfur subunit